GIPALTFWADISNRSEVIIGRRKIRSATIKRAITITGAGGAVWLLIILMLETTQQIPARQLVFEATSALGTVGLTIGATPLLDEMGKIIVMIAMFAGRVGPMTLFMLLGTERVTPRSRCLDAKISLS
ncbi:MAG: potassium transporter TrkH, partial [Desulfobulbaceae bacterium]|nr:potassium transporter TrkH [Desulfobulbaceae bacterium]